MSDNTRQPDEDITPAGDLTGLQESVSQEFGPNQGISRSNSIPRWTQEDAIAEVAKTNFLRGVDQERERCARILTEFVNYSKLFPSQYSPKAYTNALVAIAARIRSGE